jgi:hypothetical protein
VTERVQEFGPTTLQSKLQFVTVKDRQVDERAGEGLGPLPGDLNTVGALTVYNTAESPYSAGVKSDPLAARSRARRPQEDQEDIPEEGGPPEGEGVMMGRDQDNMFYSPDLGDLPDFDLPDDLMLPNIAQDLNYSQVRNGIPAVSTLLRT